MIVIVLRLKVDATSIMTPFEDIKLLFDFMAFAVFSLLGTVCLLFASKAYRVARTHELRLYSATGFCFGVATILAQFAVFLVTASDDAWYRTLPSLFLIIAFVNILIASICIYSNGRYPSTNVETVITVFAPLLTPILAYHQTPQGFTPPVWFSLVLYSYVAISVYLARHRIFSVFETHSVGPSTTKRIAEPDDARESPS